MIAISVGLSYAATLQSRAEEKQARELKTSEVTGMINAMANEAKSKGNDVVNKLYDKLQSAYFPGAAGAAVKRYIVEARNKLEKRYNDAKNKQNELAKDYDVLTNNATSFDMASDKYKASDNGKRELNDLKDQANKLAEKYNDLGVEKYAWEQK